MKYKDYYQVLGIERNATAEDIKRAYRWLARKYHPDVSKEADAEERFKEVGEAYEVLKDPEKRAAYNDLGNYRAGQEFRPPPDWGSRAGHDFGGRQADFSDFFAEMFGGHPAGQGFAARGQDFEATVEIALEQALHATETTLRFDMPQWDKRSGHMRRTPREIKVRIPRGATDGQKLRVPGKGGKGMNGAPDGDLYLRIVLRPHPLFKPSGHDLYLEVPVAPWEAALGAAIEVPTLEGRARIKIHPGAKAGQKLRLAGKGLPKSGHGHGDLYAVLQVVSPAVLNEREKSLFEALAKTSMFNPRRHFDGG
ncbi:MAG TPA: hypothetical protein DEP05_10260 [Betaproteobacteria bacterium]|nr:hypothetical protein [Betaproteobacteria bacterium]